MTTYVYRSKRGATVERQYPMGKAPKAIKVKGRRFERQISGGLMVSVEKNYQARAFQFDDDDAKLAAKVGAKVDAFGPLLTSKKMIRAFQDQLHVKSQGKADYKYEFGLHNK